MAAASQDPALARASPEQLHSEEAASPPFTPSPAPAGGFVHSLQSTPSQTPASSENSHASSSLNTAGQNIATSEDSPTSARLALARRIRDKVLNKRQRLEALANKYQPGNSTSRFFSFYENLDMASTRSSLRGKFCSMMQSQFIPSPFPNV